MFHHEQAQSPRWPSKLFFCCEKAADAGDGGQTGVCRSDQVLDQLTKKHPQFVRKCEDLGVKYVSLFFFLFFLMLFFFWGSNTNYHHLQTISLCSFAKIQENETQDTYIQRTR